MTKEKYLTTLRAALTGLPESDIVKSSDYWAEMIDDRIEEGMQEEAAVAALEPPAAAARQVLMSSPLSKVIRARIFPSYSLHTGERIAVIIGFPLWFPLTVAAAAVGLSLYVALWVIIASLYAIDLAFAVAALGGLTGGIISLLTGSALSAAYAVGAGLICLSICLVLFFVFNRLSVLLLRLSKQFLQGIKTCFVRRDEKA